MIVAGLSSILRYVLLFNCLNTVSKRAERSCRRCRLSKEASASNAAPTRIFCFRETFWYKSLAAAETVEICVSICAGQKHLPSLSKIAAFLAFSFSSFNFCSLSFNSCIIVCTLACSVVFSAATADFEIASTTDFPKPLTAPAADFELESDDAASQLPVELFSSFADMILCSAPCCGS